MYFSGTEKRYYQYSKYLRNKFQTKVYKITLNAGFGCPNRDGTKSFGGCLFCDEAGSFSRCYDADFSIKNQVDIAIKFLEERFKAKKFISYFQSYTNTYAPLDVLEKTYSEAFCDDRIVGLSIGTRPDCVDRDKIALISSFAQDKEVWIEYGLQSSSDKTLKLINRSSTFQDFANAIEMTKGHGIKTCAHVILGLPEETEEDMLNTAKDIAHMGIDGIKLHVLCILKNTKLEKLYNEKKIFPMEEDRYVELVCKFLELLPKNMIVQRLTGNGYSLDLIGPKWLDGKFTTLTKIDNYFAEHNSCQGAKFFS